MVWQVLLLFMALSLLALGGGSAIIPELQRQVVLERHWLTDRQFVDLYALTQVTPGPSMMIVCLVGLAAAGLPGALAAYVGMFGPTSLLVLSVRQGWERLKRSRWKRLIEAVTRPVAVGTMLASATVLARSGDPSPMSYVVSVAAAAAIASGRIGILPTMAVAGLLGGLGWV